MKDRYILPVLGRAVVVCGAITASIGGLVLVGWAANCRAITGIRTAYAPMPPNTALLCVLLGIALLGGTAWPASRVVRRSVAWAAVLSMIVAVLTLIDLGLGGSLAIDHWLVYTPGMFGKVPEGHMSPITAACFLLAGASLLLLQAPSQGPGRRAGELDHAGGRDERDQLLVWCAVSLWRNRTSGIASHVGGIRGVGGRTDRCRGSTGMAAQQIVRSFNQRPLAAGDAADHPDSYTDRELDHHHIAGRGEQRRGAPLRGDVLLVFAGHFP